MKQIERTDRPRSQGAKVFLAATATAQLCALARYTILARFLGPEELGLVAMLTLTSQFFQSITDNGSDRFLIQDKDGDTPAVQGLVQALFVSRGAVQAIGLALFAGPIALYFQTPSLQPALIILALAPLIFGFLHLDFRRDQRRADFRSEATVTLVSEILSLIVTAVAAFITRDFTAVLYGLITRSLAYAVTSHVLAKTPYRFSYSKEHAARLARFSVPLMFNGLLLFVGSQGDRVVVANELGISQLGHYTAILMLAYYPASTIMRYMGSMHLPHIAAGRHDNSQRDAASDTMGGQTLILAAGIAMGFALVAPTATVLLFGNSFAQPAIVIAMIGIFQAFRFMRQWPTTVALGISRSEIVLANNIMRMSGLACALFAVRLYGGMVSVTAGFILGELLALITAIALVNRASERRLFHDWDRIALLVIISLLVIGWTTVIEHHGIVRITALAFGTVAALTWLIRREWATIQRALALGIGVIRKT
ncbi:MAG: oligosaccharide flippase family protein [Hyphomonadaceae bacterium]|nr:oligosaccharide flippase family protein [Hyphomonadaceae bacterium]